MNNIISVFRKISLSKFIVLSITTCLLISFLISLILSYVNIDYLEIDYLKNKGLSYIFILTVLVAPVLETLIFQYGIIELLFRLKNKNKILYAILASAIVFGLSHYYNIFYVLNSFILGLAFATFYIIAKIRKDINPLYLLFSIHSLINLVAFIFNDVL